MTGHGDELDEETCAALVPRRDERAHKGSHGTVVVVAGSLDYAGAALLCGLAAARAGAGLVCLAVPASLQPILAGRVPETITLALPESADGLVEAGPALERIAARQPAALVVGPGLAANPGTTALVRAIVTSSGAPAVLDAEALNVLATMPDWWNGAARPLVLTPHPGEFARLDGAPVGADDASRVQRARVAADRWRVVVVLKGALTVVCSPDARPAVAPWANAALATAGTGDVLAGSIGALLAQGLEPFDAARLGVYLHGAAAECERGRLGDSGLLASDLPLLMAEVRFRLATSRDTDPVDRT